MGLPLAAEWYIFKRFAMQPQLVLEKYLKDKLKKFKELSDSLESETDNYNNLITERDLLYFDFVIHTLHVLFNAEY